MKTPKEGREDWEMRILTRAFEELAEHPERWMRISVLLPEPEITKRLLEGMERKDIEIADFDRDGHRRPLFDVYVDLVRLPIVASEIANAFAIENGKRLTVACTLYMRFCTSCAREEMEGLLQGCHGRFTGVFVTDSLPYPERPQSATTPHTKIEA